MADLSLSTRDQRRLVALRRLAADQAGTPEGEAAARKVLDLEARSGGADGCQAQSEEDLAAWWSGTVDAESAAIDREMADMERDLKRLRREIEAIEFGLGLRGYR